MSCKGYLDYREMLQDPAVDAVVVAVPNWLHREVTVESLAAGKHVLVEKPMASTVAECDAMIAAAEAAGKTLMVGHSQHFFPVNIEARRIFRSGGIGRIVMATDTWYKPFHGDPRPPWFLDDRQGGGMWPMNGSHMIDRLTFFLDSPVTAIRAKVGNPIWGLSSDMGIAFLEFAGGVCATAMHAGYRDGVNRFEAEITGTEGQLRIDGDRGGGRSLWRSRNGEWEEIVVLPEEPSIEIGMSRSVFETQMQEFARSILEGRPPAITAEYGRQVVRVLEACVESSRIGQEIRLS
jgi:predicted dehydrogenase